MKVAFKVWLPVWQCQLYLEAAKVHTWSAQLQLVYITGDPQLKVGLCPDKLIGS